MKGLYNGKIYATVEVKFDDVWSDLNDDEQKQIISENISLLEDENLIDELESRGYTIEKK